MQGKQFQRVVLRVVGCEQEQSSSRILIEPRASADELLRAAVALLEELLSAEMAVQTLSLSVGSLRAADQQQASLFFDRPERREAIAAMNRRHPGGLLRVGRPRSVGATHGRKETGAGASLTSRPTPASDLRGPQPRAHEFPQHPTRPVADISLGAFRQQAGGVGIHRGLLFRQGEHTIARVGGLPGRTERFGCALAPPIRQRNTY